MELGQLPAQGDPPVPEGGQEVVQGGAEAVGRLVEEDGPLLAQQALEPLLPLGLVHRQEPLEDEPLRRQSADRQGGDEGAAAGDGLNGHAVFGAQAYQVLAGVADGGGADLGDLSPRAAATLENASFVAAEDTRVTRKLLSHLGLQKPCWQGGFRPLTAGGWCVIFAEKGRKGRDLPMLPTFFIRSQGIRKLYCSLFTPLLERRGLTQLEMDILLFLANNPEYDTARDIVEKRHLAKSHVSVGVDALAGRGLLERQLREGNRKTIHLRLTEAAGPIVEEGRAIQREHGEILLSGFTGEERVELLRLLEKIGENVDAALRAAK